MKVLVNAYAAGPDVGSEPGMGWNWCVHLAKHCELFVITEGEFRSAIEKALDGCPYRANLHFYYNPVSEEVRRMCWNQGDWRFYLHYSRWQRSTLKIARQIAARHKIELIHQLNLTGFREPGLLWKIKGVPFVWGPFVAGITIPRSFRKGMDVRDRLFFGLKAFISCLQARYSVRVRKASGKASALVGATPDSIAAFERFRHRKALYICETGCSDSAPSLAKAFSPEGEFRLLWVGRFIYTKQLEIALKTVALLQDIGGLQLDICGDGPGDAMARYKAMAEELGIGRRCRWHGRVPNGEVQALMRRSDLFFFTSIAEASSTVVPEAIGNHLPVLCFDACGFGPIVSGRIGRKVKLLNAEQAVGDFASAIRELEGNRRLLKEMSANCEELRKELAWDRKAEQMFALYKSLLR